MNVIFNQRSSLSVFLFLLIPLLNITAQENNEVKSAYAPEQHITRMENGLLLVKLNTQSKRIAARQKYGDNKSADKLITEVKKEHQEIKNGFKESFDYMKYFFFKSDDARDVIKGKNWSEILSNYENVDSDSNQPIYLAYLEKPDWYSSTDTYFFIIYSLEDGELIRLKKPLPFYSSTKSNKLFKRTDYKRSIQKLNAGLHRYNENLKKG